MNWYDIYTDGSCFPISNGCGGWAFAVVKNNEIVYYKSGSENNTTNNRMELTAVLEALRYIDTEHCQIFSHSMYTVKAISEWYRMWVIKNKAEEKSNIDLIEEAYKLYTDKKAHLFWIRGRNGNEFNEFVYELCTDNVLELYQEVQGVEITKEEINNVYKSMIAYNKQQNNIFTNPYYNKQTNIKYKKNKY